MEGWGIEWRREGLIRRRDISCLTAAVVICLCGGLGGEKVFLISLKEMLKFWEETLKKKDLSQIMVTLKGRFKGDTGEKCHMLTLPDTTKSVIGVRKWVGRRS